MIGNDDFVGKHLSSFAYRSNRRRRITMELEFPENINKILLNKNYHENTVGKTDSKVYMYDDFVLKVQKTSNETKNEFEIMKKLNDKLPIPKAIEYVEQD